MRDPFERAKSSILLVSGRFRKVSGSLSGSLRSHDCFVAVPEGSGRFPEACPEACFLFCLNVCSSGSFRKIPGSLSGSFFEHVDLLHPGSFPEGYRKTCRKWFHISNNSCWVCKWYKSSKIVDFNVTPKS